MDKSMKKDTKLVLLIRSLLFSYIITAIILLLLALFMYKLDVSNSVISAGVIIAYIFSNFLGGLMIGKNVEQKKFFWGIINGIFYFLVIVLISIFLGKTIFAQLGSAITVFIMCTLGGMLGGMVS